MRPMLFTKMHGAGNDYVYLDGFEHRIAAPSELARRISDRHFGVGGDGLIVIQPPESRDADCRMEIYNADGSRAQMCGNGIRCVAKYVYDRRRVERTEVRIETDAGLKVVRVFAGPAGKVDSAEVDMGPPILERGRIPFRDGGDPRLPAIGVPVVLRGETYRLTAVSMGNPHAVIRVPSPPEAPPIEGWPVAAVGPALEHHPWFPERVNVEFISVRTRSEIDARVWERGSGETLACGTGACAAVVAAAINGWCDPDVLVHLRGGDLRVRWEGARADRGVLEGGTVFMAGPAVEVFTGEWPD